MCSELRKSWRTERAAGYRWSVKIEEVYMPQASTPEDTSRLIGEAITSGDIDAALSLYEPDATFAMPKGSARGRLRASMVSARRLAGS